MLEQLLDANTSYSSRFELAKVGRGPRLRVAVLTCMDPRLDPSRIFGLTPGDAVILRNAGARVTADVLRSLSLAAHLLGVEEVAIVQHTACALSGTDDAELAATLVSRGASLPPELMAMSDPDAALASDVSSVRESPLLPHGICVEGWRYDVADGSVARLVVG